MSKPLDAASDLHSTIDAAAERETGDPIPEEVVDEIRDAGLYGLMIARDAGGSECGLEECLDVFAQLSYSDGSTGWCVMASNTAAAYFSSWCDDALVERVFGDGHPIVAGQFAPNGVLTPDGDDWKLNGAYQFGSGMNDADWAGAGALIEGPEDRAGDYRFIVMPRDEVELKGNWDVMGLEATASWDYVVDDVTVPDNATFSFADHIRHRGGPLYDLGVLPLTALGHAAWAIGVVRRTLDELATTALTRKRMTGSAPLGESEYFQMGLADLEAGFAAARSWVYEAFRDAEAAAVAGAIEPRHVLETRMATTHVNQLGGKIVREALVLGGTVALRKGPIERCFRDMHAGTQHAMVSPAVSLEFGLDAIQKAAARSPGS